MPDVTNDKGDVIGTTDGAPEGYMIPLVQLAEQHAVVEPDESVAAEPPDPFAGS